MPQKTIYLRDKDLETWEKADGLAGERGSVSSQLMDLLQQSFKEAEETTQYFICYADNAEGLAEQVESLLAADWQLQGGICFTGKLWAQALTCQTSLPAD